MEWHASKWGIATTSECPIVINSSLRIRKNEYTKIQEDQGSKQIQFHISESIQSSLFKTKIFHVYKKIAHAQKEIIVAQHWMRC